MAHLKNNTISQDYHKTNLKPLLNKLEVLEKIKKNKKNRKRIYQGRYNHKKDSIPVIGINTTLAKKKIDQNLGQNIN